jgi:hypothetical protein
MSRFNTTTSHPLIPNSNSYFLEKKYVSVHSEDRDCLKYPTAAEFEIELPQDYVNIQSARLYSWSFPANYDVFSVSTENVTMTFQIVNPYNPGDHNYSDPLTEAIFAGLYYNKEQNFLIDIEPGFYNPDQMATELSNKFNESVTNYLNLFFKDPKNAQYSYAQSLFVNYDRFRIVYNSVGQKLWFGNTSDKFVLTNDSELKYREVIQKSLCIRRDALPSFTAWGLPSFLGFTRCNAVALSFSEIAAKISGNSQDFSSNAFIPRFYYGDVTGTGDNGYWLLSDLPGATVYYLQAPEKINFMGPAYMYMEVDGFNCLDETSPYNVSKFTRHTNETNGVVNSAFAKIPVPTTPLSQWFDNDMTPYKYFNPPAERIRKLKIKFRYHSGQLVDFGSFDYTFMIEFTLLSAQQQRNMSIRDSSSQSTLLSFS